MLQPTTAQKILDAWARKRLDFEPGTKWEPNKFVVFLRKRK
jgi:hypothetical protein